MWNLEQTEQFVMRTRPIILAVTVVLLLLMTLYLNPGRLSRDLAEPRPVTLQQTLK